MTRGTRTMRPRPERGNDDCDSKYERFRRRLLLPPLASSSTPGDLGLNLGVDDLVGVGTSALEVASSNRRSYHRARMRLGPMLELIARSFRRGEEDDDGAAGGGITPRSSAKTTAVSSPPSSIADVGCDHGMLALSLACMSLAASTRRRRRRRPRAAAADDDDGDDAIGGGPSLFYARVVGTDLSPIALGNGALVSRGKVEGAMASTRARRRRADAATAVGGAATVRSVPHGDVEGDVDGDVDCDGRPSSPSLPVEFRVGRGLDPLCPGEADAVVLAGMGAQTMLEICLGPPASPPDATTPPPPPLPVDRVRTVRIFLQPTNSRPQHMVMLYERMQGSGDWSLEGETIACSGGRWYVNSLFERRRRRDDDGDDYLGVGGSSSSSSSSGGGGSFRFPGHFLVRDASADGSGAYDSYVRHHLRWLREDCERPKYSLDDEDRRWLEYMSSAEENDKWKCLASWFGG